MEAEVFGFCKGKERFALKIMKRREEEGELLAEYNNMLRITSQYVLRADCIVQLKDGQQAMAMPFCVAMSVMLAGGAFGPNSALTAQAAEQILKGCGAVHDTGIAHGDIKPQNVVYHEGERVFKLIDLPSVTPNGGSKYYRAPEIAMGSAATPKSDIYSTGVIVGHMLDLPGIVGPWPTELEYMSHVQQHLAKYKLKGLVLRTPAKRPDAAEAVLLARRQLILQADSSPYDDPEPTSPRSGAMCFLCKM